MNEILRDTSEQNESRFVDKQSSYNRLLTDLFLLKGKVEAVGVYISHETYPNPEVIAEMLGVPYVKREKS